MSSLALLVSTTLLATVQAGPCDDVPALRLQNATITSVEWVPADSESTEDGAMLPEHCRVAAVLTPSPDSEIQMEIWLPTRDWNGKFLAVGNGGWAGTISRAAAGVREGYAAASTDTGHTGPPGEFAVGHPEKVVDFAYRSMHELAVQSKVIIDAVYGEEPRLSYFNGCSTGGWQGLAAAQRYPSDFDAIIAGAPVYNRPHLHASEMQKFVEIMSRPERLVPRDKIEMIANAVINSCDADDGVVDGLINDPQTCSFDPRSLACSGSDTGMCLTPAQVGSLERAYSPTYAAGGDFVYPGHARGFELQWRMPEPDSAPRASPMASFRYLGHEDPDWNWRDFELATDLALVLASAGALEAADPDLSEFRARGGKLIMYHGWSDPGPSPLSTIRYYDQVLATMGPDQSDWMRLYLMPGMGHCRGGVGPDQANFLATMERWVESGVAPDRIRASRVRNGQVEMTRPICPYPEVSKWTGVGSTNDAENFVCEMP
jgi:feruloyl esterase